MDKPWKDETVIDRLSGRDITRFGTRNPNAIRASGPKVRDVKIWRDTEGKLQIEIKELQPPPL